MKDSCDIPRFLIGFDFGLKKIGIAIGHPLTLTARPLETIKAKAGVPHWSALSKIITRWSPNALVVGIPLNMDGSEQPLSKRAKEFAHQLQDRYKLPVYETDERLTTKEAREQLFTQGGFKALQDGQVDSVAAQLILQHWMNENCRK